MHARAFARAVGLMAVAVVMAFGLLLALPLPRGFFREWGLVTGPLAWIVCAVVTGRVLGLPSRRLVGATVLSGVAAAAVGIGLDHSAGIAAGLLVFAAAAATASRRRSAEVGA